MQGTILIADEQLNRRILLKARLSPGCYAVVTVGDLDALEPACRAARPDVIVLSGPMRGVPPDALCARLKSQAQAQLAQIPVVVLLARDDPTLLRAALAAGAEDVISRPEHDGLLQARLRAILRMRPGPGDLRLAEDGSTTPGLIAGFGEPQPEYLRPARVALVGPSLQGLLAGGPGPTLPHPGRRPALETLAPPDVPRRLATGPAADVYVLDAGTCGVAAAMTLLADLRAGPDSRHSGVLVVLGPEQRRHAAEFFDRSADDLMHGMPGGPDPEELWLRLSVQIARKRRRDRQDAELRARLRAAMTDPLTGLRNRRYAMTRLACALGEAPGRPLAVMIADLDHFKQVNDRFGHAAGDRVLVETGRRLGAGLGPQDMLARIGGEEFLILLPGASEADARARADQICRSMAAAPFRIDSAGRSLRATVSIGLATIAADEDRGAGGAQDIRDLLARADAALFAAKQAGRNRALPAA